MTDIARLEKAQQRDSDVLANLHRLGLLPDVLIAKRQELRDKIAERQTKIESLRNAPVVVKPIPPPRQVRKIDPIDTDLDIVPEKKIKKHHDYERPLEKEYDYHFKQYCRAIESLPDYYQTNLKDMPNNKGYIWRGMWFLGEKAPERNQPLILFEKNRGVMHIHEYDRNEYRLYEKIGKDKKTLLKCERRK